MTDVLVRNVPDDTLDLLKKRARRHRRSLQQEILAIIEEQAEVEAAPKPTEIAARIRERLRASGRTFGDSVDDLRADRER
jgi:antitoxin FitA